MGAVVFTGNQTDFYGAISKAKQSQYRSSALGGLNPTSTTEVKRGSAPMRYARFIGGGMAGSLVGSAAGAAAPRQFRPLIQGIGAAGGMSAGATRNVKTGDVRITNKRTGKKAKGKIVVSSLHPGFATY